MRPSRFHVFGLAVSLIVLPVPAVGADDSAGSAVTAADPQVPLDELALMVKPLTKAQLETEADAWMAVLRAKVREVSEGELAAKRVESPEAKAELLAALPALREQRTALIDRADLVLDELEAKGGDPAEHRKYLSAVGGLIVDVSDTAAVVTSLTGWLKSPEGGVKWARRAGAFLVLLVAFWILALIAGGLVARTTRMSKRLSSLMRDFITRTAKSVVLIVGFIVALSALGINIGPLLAVIGAAGFVVAFALQDSLGNLASGIMILVYRPFDVGDAVEVGGVLGAVKSMNLVSTTITTFDNKVIVVPNNKIWGDVITNITGSTQRRVDMVFGIGYESDIAKAQDILERIVAEHPLTLEDPAPNIRVHELGDSSVNFICRPWASTGDYWTVYWDITRAVKEEFDKAGITIPFPQRDVHVHYPQKEPPVPEVEPGAGRRVVS